MTFVNHGKGLIFFSQRHYFVELGHIAIHAKYPIGYNDDVTNAVFTRLLQLQLQVGHVVILVAITLCFAQSNPIDDRGVVEAIAHNGIFLAKKRLKNTPIRIKCCGIQNGIVGLVEAGNSGF